MRPRDQSYKTSLLGVSVTEDNDSVHFKMSKTLVNTVALVTGASSGIGLEVATHLAESGATVAVAARRKERLDELVARIEAKGGKALAVPIDIAEPGAAEALIDTVVSKLGRLDTLVNNAGIFTHGPSESADLATWDNVFDLNVRALTHVTIAALPHLLKAVESSERKVADVVNISSVAGRNPSARLAAYNASKFAVTGITESWRQEFGKRSVRFSSVEPGLTETEILDKDDPLVVAWSKDIELLQASDIAESVNYIVTRPRRVVIPELVIRPTNRT